ncbi:MAG: hypothetical protein K0B08_05855 [Bacteroidales bacterium]|nr:hypothetical protein [Bacteroidales bacterium]
MTNLIKILIQFSFLILFSTMQVTCISQAWPKVYGYQMNAFNRDILEDYDKGYYICACLLKSGSEYKYGWLIKTDINGNIIWHKKFGSHHDENAFYDFDQTQDHSLIISGATSLIDPEIDPLFIKLNTCGEIEWCKIYLSPGFNTANGVISLPDGNFLGMLQYYGGNYAHVRISLVKMDSEGNPIWIKHLAQEDSTVVNEEGRHLYFTPDGNYLVAGSCFSPSLKPYFIKTDTSGEEIWDVKWPVGNSGFANRTVFTSYGIIYSACGLQFPGIPRKPYILKFSEDGEIISQFPLLGDTIERGGADALFLDSDSIFYSGIVWTDDPYLYSGYSDILKTDTNGNIKLQRRLMNDLFAPNKIIKTFDSKLLTIGSYELGGNLGICLWKMNTDLEDDTLYTQPFTYDSLCPYEIQSDTVELDCGLFVNIDEIPTKEEYESTIKISPNPAREWVVLTLPDVVAEGEVLLVVYDIFGREAWRHGGMEAWRHGGLGAWRHGGMGVWERWSITG